MTNYEFLQANQAWARNLLAQPAYTMPNGKNSHEVANEVIDDTEDKLIDATGYTAYGERKPLEEAE